jgi:hypothetical protein
LFLSVPITIIAITARDVNDDLGMVDSDHNSATILIIVKLASNCPDVRENHFISSGETGGVRKFDEALRAAGDGHSFLDSRTRFVIQGEKPSKAHGEAEIEQGEKRHPIDWDKL